MSQRTRSSPRLAEETCTDIRDEEQNFRVVGVRLDGSPYVKKVLEKTAERSCTFLRTSSTSKGLHPSAAMLPNLRRGALASRARHQRFKFLGRDGRQTADAHAAFAVPRAPCSCVVRTQLTLPLRLEGCRITRASDVASLAAFTGKWAFHISGRQFGSPSSHLFVRIRRNRCRGCYGMLPNYFRPVTCVPNSRSNSLVPS